MIQGSWWAIGGALAAFCMIESLKEYGVAGVD